MIIVDTSVWIEFFRNNNYYINIIEKLIEERKIYAIECIFGELLQGSRSEREINIITQYWVNLPKVQEEGIWILAGNISYKNKLFSKGVGLIDLAILSAARENKLKIWTLDKKFGKVLSSQEKFEI